MIWYENFNHQSADYEPGSITSVSPGPTGCPATTINTFVQTNCIPSGWRTGRLETSGSDRGRQGAATTQWDRLIAGGNGNYSIEFEPSTDQWGGLMSPGATLTAGVQYSFEFYYRIPGSSGSGTWVVNFGLTNSNTQQSLPTLTQILSRNTNTNTTWVRLCHSFTVSSTGTYYIYLRIRNSNSSATQRFLMDDMSLYTSPSCLSVLAVTLNNFTARCENNSTRITWQTASEQNSDYFTLERSRDGQNWIEVATVDGAGTTNNVSNYTIDDTSLFSEMYYRLKQTDYDGKNEYFNPIIVNCNSDKNGMIVFPNPSTGNFTVEINSSEKLENAAVVVYDLSGKQLMKQIFNGTMQGTNAVYFEDGNLASGTYLVVLESDSKNNFKPVKLVIE